MKARTLLKKLTDYGLTIKIAGNKIRLSPPKLVNNKVIVFVQTYKNDLIYALRCEHEEKKNLLNQDRLHVLRCLIHHNLKSGIPGQMKPNSQEVEDFIDEELRRFNYDLEDLTTTYRNIIDDARNSNDADSFLACFDTETIATATCDTCIHFTADKIGDGTGIGTCNEGIKWTDETQGRLPLYRFTHRHCDKFSKLID